MCSSPTLSSVAVRGSIDWPILEILLTSSTREGSSGVCRGGGVRHLLWEGGCGCGIG